MAIKYIDDFDFNDKRVIARFDFNVPLDKNDRSKITDTTRIDRTLDTINFLIKNGASKIILMSHLGRPKGKIDLNYSLEPVATYLAEKLGQDVILTETCIDRGIKTLIDLPETKIVLLQNLRFHPEEETNSHDFAKKLASYADIYVNDAFGTSHRKHASTYEINKFFSKRALGGFLIRKEIEALEKIVNAPKTPFVAIIGGAKVSDKIKIIENLLPKISYLLIGGAMAYPFLKAQGKEIGKSLCSNADVSLAKKLLSSSFSKKIVLPIDHIISSKFSGTPELAECVDIPPEKMALDIGPKTITLFSEKLAASKTILWNGPMGLFENDDFAKGTFAVANTLAELKDTFTLVGGGDSVSAVNQINLADKMSHVSTGGGASLEFIENESLPGIQALKFGL